MSKNNSFPKFLDFLAKNLDNLTFTEKFALLNQSYRRGEIGQKQYLGLTSVGGYADGKRDMIIMNLWLGKVHGLGSTDPRKVKTLRRSK